MTSGNTAPADLQTPESASGNIAGLVGRHSAELPAPSVAALADYEAALRGAPLGPRTRAKYTSKVRAYLGWLATSEVDGDPLTDPAARDWAVRDYRGWLKTVARAKPSTINGSLAALGDFYTRRRLGPPVARRERLAAGAPRALDERQTRRYLRAAEQLEPRDRAVALIPYYAGLRIGEVAALDVDDVRLSARRGELVVRAGKGADGGTRRVVPVHPELRAVLTAWLDARERWPGAAGPALLLNRRGGRLSDRSGRTIITRAGAAAGLDEGDGFGPHVLRHTFATQLVRDGHDLVLVADLLGHADLGSTRVYTQSTHDDRAAALGALLTDV